MSVFTLLSNSFILTCKAFSVFDFKVLDLTQDYRNPFCDKSLGV